MPPCPHTAPWSQGSLSPFPHVPTLPHVPVSPCPHFPRSPLPHVPMAPCLHTAPWPHVSMSPWPHVPMAPHCLISPCPCVPMAPFPRVPVSPHCPMAKEPWRCSWAIPSLLSAPARPTPALPSPCPLPPLCCPLQRGHFVTMKVLYTCGYSTSLAALLLAIGIFCCFRKLHCTRNSIHIHFFTSFILRGTAVFIKDRVLFSDESIDHCTMSTVTCKAAIAFFQYSVLANFYWLLVEGLYLQTLLLLTFTCDRSYTWGYVLMGWGVPMVTVGVWVLTRIQYDNHGCWDDYSSVYWWVIKAPILLAIFVNFLIFLNVTRMLAQKIRCPDLSRTHKQQYMRLTKSTLLLIPLFGVHYVVFALFPEHVGVDARLYFELVLGSYQGFLVALLYCFLNGEVQAEIRRNWGTWQRSMESNVFNLATQDFTA
ncbi:vasoactive intestinal polypeptide receptor 1-like isoform X4 [Zonotrichia leucophrys gambelii]|uniref:vasoactive intestinal polypeptide receptor 1-like isoform X4 n=1 Tax=Zonotrichia leucophrys gambelii TaxID=257770 RepID=UPI00314088AD